MQDQVAKKSIQKAFKTSFAHILKTSKSLECLMVFGGPGCQVELKMAALRSSREQLGLMRRLLGGILRFFLHLNFEVDFVERLVQWREKVGGSGGASGGGGRLRLQALCVAFYQ